MSETLVAIQRLSGLPATKTELKEFSAKLKEEMLSGNFNPLQAHIFIKSITDTLKEVIDDKEVKDYVLEEARKFNEKTFEVYGAKCTLASTKTYKYDQCGDDVYNQMSAELIKLKEQMSAREEMIKTGVDPSTGQVFNPPSVTETEYITIKIL